MIHHGSAWVEFLPKRREKRYCYLEECVCGGKWWVKGGWEGMKGEDLVREPEAMNQEPGCKILDLIGKRIDARRLTEDFGH